MQSSDIPSKSAKVFAESASGPYIRSVPQTTADPAAASFDLGFPPQTFTDEGAGGTPPDGRDFNGVFNFLSAWARWQSAGAPVTYDATFQTDIGGYPRGAVVASATTFGIFWISTTENNLTNPDGGGAGWRKWSLSGGLVGIRVFAASTTYTPTSGTNAIEVLLIGGGGGGGGTPTMGAGQFAAAGGGGAGASLRSFLTSGFSGASIVVGPGGSGGIGAVNGSNGGTTSFGALSVTGGGGGSYGNPASIASVQLGGGGGGTPSGGSLENNGGACGAPGIAFASSNMVSGAGAPSILGGGGAALGTTTANGNNGSAPGSGGSGAMVQSTGTVKAGGTGANGVVIIREYA